MASINNKIRNYTLINLIITSEPGLESSSQRPTSLTTTTRATGCTHDEVLLWTRKQPQYRNERELADDEHGRNGTTLVAQKQARQPYQTFLSKGNSHTNHFRMNSFQNLSLSILHRTEMKLR